MSAAGGRQEWGVTLTDPGFLYGVMKSLQLVLVVTQLCEYTKNHRIFNKKKAKKKKKEERVDIVMCF